MGRRILLLITDLEIGGTPTVVRELARRLNQPPEVQVEVACLSKWGPVADQLRDLGIAVTALEARGALDLPRTIGRLRKLVKERAYDTVFSFLIHANTVAALAARKLPQVRFLQSIQTTQPFPRWHWWVQGWIESLAEKIVVPSQSVVDVASIRSGIGREKFVVIPNAIELDDFKSEIPNRPFFHIGFLGRLDPIKRLPDLIDAMRQLDDRFVLNIFGEGEQRPQLQNRIVQLGLQGRVKLHGATSSPAEALRQMDVLVLPSAAEGFGLVLIEAMALRVPIVATDAPGIRDVVRADQTGLLVPVGSPGQLAAAVQRLADDPALKTHLIENAFADVQARFTWERVLPAYRALLDL